MKTFSLALSLVLAVSWCWPPDARACQDHPRVPCDLVAGSTTAMAGEPIVVEFTVTNLLAGGGILDDLEYTISVSAMTAEIFDGGPGGGQGFCKPNGMDDPHVVDMPEVVVVLDDANSGMADDPTSWTGTFTVTPVNSPDAVWIQVNACGDVDGDGRCERACWQSVCIDILDTPDELDYPTATFEGGALRTGGAGSELPFDIRVHRNGYDPAPPLTVRVTPQNFSDPADIFPVTPAELTTVGATVLGDGELVSFSCTTHYPCFRGVANVYHVSIWDGPTELWNSAFSAWDGLAAARVDDVPLARVDIVDVRGDGGQAGLAACEHGLIHLRLYARNPWDVVGFEDVRLELDIPPELSVVSSELHFHDNPMDTVDPTPAELAATGVVSFTGGTFAVDVALIEDRFRSESPPAPVFRDLFEVELVLETPPDGFADERVLSFPGLALTGRVGARPEGMMTQPFEIVVGPARPPLEVSPVGSDEPLRVWPDRQTLSWEPSANAAQTYRVHRGEIHELHFGLYGRCIADGLTMPQVVDATPPPVGDGFFYVVAGSACGIDGPAGADSLGGVRLLEGPCP